MVINQKNVGHPVRAIYYERYKEAQNLAPAFVHLELVMAAADSGVIIQF